MKEIGQSCRRPMCAAVCAVAAGAACAWGQSFEGVGRPSGIGRSYVHRISADGSVAVGGGTVPDHAIRWTHAGGIVDLGAPPNMGVSGAWGVSADGSVLAMTVQDIHQDWHSYRWTQLGGWESLAALGAGDESYTDAVSADGTTITGESRAIISRAVRWTRAGAQALGELPGDTTSYARDVSADGSVIVGYSGSPGRAVRWIQQGAPENLGILPGWVGSWAAGVSGDGSVIVGGAEVGGNGNPIDYLPVRWTAQEGFTVLPRLAPETYAQAASFDGSVIVGGADSGPAFIWTAQSGTVDLRAYLVQHGIDMSGWMLTEATAVSADGRTIGGNGILNGLDEGWVATIGTLACYANCDESTASPVLNPADFTCFLQKFAAGDPYANCDGSTNPPVLNVQDFTCFLQKFAQGCP